MSDELPTPPPIPDDLSETEIVLPVAPISTLEIVNTVVRTLNDVIAALREEIHELGASEKRGRTRLAGMLVVLLIAALASVAGVWLNYNQGNDVKSIVSYIEECQTPDSPCKKRNDAEVGKAVLSISGSVFDSLTDCVLTTVPEKRTDEAIATCRKQYFGERK